MTMSNIKSNTLPEPKRRFKGVWIPKDLWMSKDLSLTEKFLFLEIDSYVDEDEGYCYAKNAHFAKFLQLSKPRISTAIKSLSDKGLIKVESLMNGNELIRRKLFVTKSFSDLDARPSSAPFVGEIVDSKTRNFKGIWITAQIWLNTSLTFTEKAMLAEIDSLQHPVRGCFASNPYFAEQFGLTTKWVSEVISRLHHSGFVSVTQLRDGLMTVERRVYIVNLDAKMTSSTPDLSGSLNGVDGGFHLTGDPVHLTGEPVSSNGIPPFIQPEHIEAFRDPKTHTSIDTAPGAGVSQKGEVLFWKEEVEQNKDQGVKRQSECEADSTIDFKAVIESYNTILGNVLKPVRTVSKGQKKNILSLINLEAFKEKIKVSSGGRAGVGAAEGIAELFQAVLGCPYLLGHGDRHWKADFSWIITPEKAEAILDGRYNPKPSEAAKFLQDGKPRSVKSFEELLADELAGYSY